MINFKQKEFLERIISLIISAIIGFYLKLDLPLLVSGNMASFTSTAPIKSRQRLPIGLFIAACIGIVAKQILKVNLNIKGVIISSIINIATIIAICQSFQRGLVIRHLIENLFASDINIIIYRVISVSLGIFIFEVIRFITKYIPIEEDKLIINTIKTALNTNLQILRKTINKEEIQEIDLTILQHEQDKLSQLIKKDIDNQYNIQEVIELIDNVTILKSNFKIKEQQEIEKKQAKLLMAQNKKMIQTINLFD